MDLTQQQTETLKVIDAEYSVESGHKVPQPVVHLFCRDGDRNYRQIDVEGFRPYFMMAYDEFVERTSDVVNDRHVIAVEGDFSAVEWDEDSNLTRGESEDPESVAETLTATANGTTVYHNPDTFDALDSTKLVKVFTVEPGHVGKIRDHWEQTWEADVPFTRRFLISSGIHHGVEVPTGASRVRYENWQGHSDSNTLVQEAKPCDPPDVKPRMLVADIEVRTNGGGVPDPADANNEITAITTYDNYTGEYAGWILESEEWERDYDDEEFRDDVLAELDIDLDVMRVFDHETQMVEDFHEWVLDRNFDLATGWNCIPHDEEVLMADGSRVPIEDVSVGDDVVGIDDGEATVATIENKMMTGVKETVEVQTANGENIQCTPDHEVLVGTDTGVAWKDAGDISQGDYVLTVANHPSRETERPVSNKRAYQYGLIASDGHLQYDEGVRFYNTRNELHDQFDTSNTVSKNDDGSKSQRVFIDNARNDAVAECESIGIPSGSKKDSAWDLSTLMSWDDDLIASFLAGMMDGDGTVSHTASIAAANESCRYWIKRLCRRIGVWATSGEQSVHIGRSSVERFASLVGEKMNHSEKRSAVMNLSDSRSGRSETIPSVLATDGNDTSGNGNFRRVNEYISRDDVSLKRHHAKSVGSDRADEYADFVFDKVTDVVKDEKTACYDIETSASSYVASERVVHNCNGFDYPYIIQRSYNISAFSIRDWDMGESPFNAGDEWPDPVVDGIVLFDMLDAYKKTQYRDLRSYKLEDVAQAELGMGKIQLEESLDDAWHKQPVEFMRYNVRDVEAVVEIEQSSALLDLYDNMRQVTGALYNTCNHNGPMLDTLFLRQAYESGIALTTNYEPEQGDYHGAWVADPVPGKHDTVVYPDLASLYPFILWTLNISPETMYTTKAEYRDAGYTDDQMFTAYIDKREWYTMSSGDSIELSEIDESKYKGVHDETGSRKKKGSQDFDGIFDPEFHEIYFVKPSVEEGFIRSTIDMLVDLKYRYKGQGDMYSAVKRVTNSCFTPDTEVMTPDGIVSITDLTVGDDVYSWNPETNQMEVKQVTDTVHWPDYSGDMVDIETSRIDFSLTPDHDMWVKRRRKTDTFEKTEAGTLNDYTRYELPNNWTFDHSDSVGDTIDVASLIASCDDVDRSVEREDGMFHAGNGAKNIPCVWNTEDFVEFIGWYVTEGNTYDNGESGWYIDIAQHETGDGDRDAIRDLFERVGLNYYECSTYFRLSSKVLGQYLDCVCGKSSADKKLPDWVWGLSKQQKQVLHDTLMSGDGDRYSGNRYSTQSEILRDQFMCLSVELGYNTRYGYDSDCWRVRFDTGSNTFQMNRTENRGAGSTSEAPDDGVYCVTVEDNHTIVAGRNGKFNVVGQCYGVLGDSASGGKGFRLFDWKLAESITLGGQKVINYTADQYIRLINQYSEEAGYEPNSYLVGGDTDSVMTAIPQAPDYGTALEWSQRASEEFQPDEETGDPGLYDEFMEEEFNVIFGEDQHKMDVEIESLGSSLFFMQDGDNEDKAVKKRYAQHMIWDEDDGWLHEDLQSRSKVSLADYEAGGILSADDATDNIGIKGFEYVRSDSATVTKEAQLNVLTYILLADDTSDRIYKYLTDLNDEIYSDDFDVAKLGRPKGISNELDEYGWKSIEELENDTNYTVSERDEERGGRYVSTPSPAYRGAKYADEHIPWEDIGAGAKPIRFYVEKVRGDKFPPAYKYETYPQEEQRGDPPEVGRRVDAIAVEDPDRVPREFVLDKDKMVEKELKDKIQPILRTIGEDWDGLVGEGRQSDLDAWM